mmetsp:Transcript_1541/g.2194  ORF Transcript_1541/g.2194 Transcript_1541/m.2194 type:complete len:191 (-) Transcript_1541:299-871(-)|eukprot:CAMPEP_0185723870 /NCGR_PEP_ID=MMETSP1171-20130828/564_1 /TAXON_ID=374046 /ORGANISM="Helicotheca tamensis, Strain CCMP826" /LENGTH=190 /DNA_ID=CAMNT_0028391633 /DNA_START=65 /DNA_END=637 /DNA_ORIENTATION=+
MTQTNATANVEDETDVIITPRDPKTLHNFGPASPRDEILFTSERPGGDPGDDGDKISSSTVKDWVEFMKSMGIKHVLILLDDNELDIYEPPGLLDLYAENGLMFHRNPMGEDGASSRAIQTIRDVEAAGEKVVAHCTHGMGRSGRVAAGWLVRRHGLSTKDATDEAVETARSRGMQRMGNQKALEKWLEG